MKEKIPAQVQDWLSSHGVGELEFLARGSQSQIYTDGKWAVLFSNDESVKRGLESLASYPQLGRWVNMPKDWMVYRHMVVVISPRVTTYMVPGEWRTWKKETTAPIRVALDEACQELALILEQYGFDLGWEAHYCNIGFRDVGMKVEPVLLDYGALHPN